MQFLKNNVCAPKGFTAIGKPIGIKKSGKPDFAVIYSEVLADAAAVYTSNKVKGAPLYVTKKHLSNGKAQAIIVNSGVSNVCTGKKGIKDAEDMAKFLGNELGINPKDVVVASTGLIGAYLPMETIKNGIKGIKNELSVNSDASKAILTTDLAEKEIAVKADNFIIGAIAKGSGMIHPNMATMLCFMTTDAKMPSKKLNAMLKNSVNKSFNMINVDMDQSTSDMAVILANGMAGKANEKKFQKALDFACIELAKKIAKDGEGATKLIEINAKNAKTEEDAKKIAKSIINSNLVKCAIFGKDVNWGRLMCAIGNSGVKFNENSIDIYFDNEKIVENGKGANYDLKKVKKLMDKDNLKIVVDLKQGNENATAYGCDMSYDYIKINAEYTT